MGGGFGFLENPEKGNIGKYKTNYVDHMSDSQTIDAYLWFTDMVIVLNKPNPKKYIR